MLKSALGISRRMSSLRDMFCAVAVVSLSSTAFANPQSGQVVGGSATITPTSPSRVDINQQSQKAIIDWQSFSIANGETTNFNQPDSSSIILNCVTGIDPSKILGNLTANGQVWLVNPNGILFGKSAHVDVAGLLATTIDIDNKNFMTGNYQFDGLKNSSAMVENQGAITIHDAGLAALVAPGVANSGIIQANLGQIQLSSAAGFTVDFYGDGTFNFLLDKQVTQAIAQSDGTKPAAAVTDTGKLIADGGKILLTANVARSVVDSSINMSGYAEATSASVSNGEITLDGGSEGTVQVSGDLNASGIENGQTGGKVEITGDVVHLANGARVTAAGDSGGGKVMIGGDFQGGNPNPALQSTFGFTNETEPVRNANSVAVDSGAVIDASAVKYGNGGQVAIWSNGATTVAGTVFVTGGLLGNGGFVETSSHGLLDVSKATIIVWGRYGGKWGYWLLDPKFTVTAANDVNTGITINVLDLLAIYDVGNLLPDTDDAGSVDPGEESESRFPWSVVPRNGLFQMIGSSGPTPVGEGVNFTLATSSGVLILGMNSEDGGPAGQYDVNVAVVSRGDLALNLALLAIPYVGELADTALAIRIANLLRLGEEVSPVVDLLIDAKIEGQMIERGWSEEEMLELQRTEPTGTSIDNTAGQNDPATVYGNKNEYMVVNDRTGEVVQISNKNDPNWIPDSRIEWK